MLKLTYEDLAYAIRINLLGEDYENAKTPEERARIWETMKEERNKYLYGKTEFIQD